MSTAAVMNDGKWGAILMLVPSINTLCTRMGSTSKSFTVAMILQLESKRHRNAPSSRTAGPIAEQVWQLGQRRAGLSALAEVPTPAASTQAKIIFSTMFAQIARVAIWAP